MNLAATLLGLAKTHPNRGTRSRRGPTPAEVLAARERAGITQTQAAAKISASLRAWQAYEDSSSGESGRTMHPGLFELFLIKTGQPLPAWLRD